MRGCVTSPYDVAGGGQSLLDAACRLIDSDQIDSHFDTLECYSFLWDMFKEDGTSLNSTSPTDTTSFTNNENVQVRSNNSPIKSLHDTTQKSDCSPDDGRTFLAHPLTRVTHKLNGTETNTIVNAEALLRENKHFSSVESGNKADQEKHGGFIDIISDHKSSPPLSSGRQDINSSPSPKSLQSPVSGTIYLDETYEEVVDEDCSQNSSDMPMSAYVNILLQDNTQLEDYILGKQSADYEEVNTDNIATENIILSGLKKRKSVKKSVESTLQKRGPKEEVKRATRKARSKSGVFSTANDLPRQVNNRPVSNDHSGAAYPQLDKVGVFLGHGHQFQPEGAVVASKDVTKTSSVVASSITENAGSSALSEGDVFTTYSSANGTYHNSSISTVLQIPTNNSTCLQLPRIQRKASSELNFLTTPVTINSSSCFPCSSNNQLVIAASSSSSVAPYSVSTSKTAPITNVSSTLTSSESTPHDSLKTNSDLKRALSEKICCRKSADENFASMQVFKFIPENVSSMRMDAKFSPAATIKQEEPYIDQFENQYTYGSDIIHNMHSLPHCSALAMTSSGSSIQNIIPVTMEICEGDMTTDNENNNNGVTSNSFHHISNNSIDHASFNQHRHHHHHHPLQQQQQQCHLSQSNGIHVPKDPMIAHSTHGQFFPALHQIQPVDANSHVPSSTCNAEVMNNSVASFYDNVYPTHSNNELLEANKQVVVGRYLHQQYTYGNSYTQFLNPDNYSMRSPDSGFHEPCLSPTTSSSVTLKDSASNGCIDGTKDRPKKKKSNSGGTLVRQYSSSGSDKTSPRSPAIQKLDVNNTGYTYFLETPISTTQRRNEDRITYLNKSQYYGLSLEFNTQERVIKCAVVKSVIILAFREEKVLEDERKAWEFWHGRQHSYKQRILDIDTKNCQGVLPQNIEELSFNAVAVKWNPMEGPVRVNIAVHCLSTDFSNQKGVKGIPLHVQIDTYEQSPKESHLVHRGYCQIKAFCDKGAERKTRDEERRKASKSKPDEFGQVTITNKGRKKVEEVFHEPCERSAFYSMANTISSPVFFNPLYENTEFLHKSLTVGVVPSQDEEVSSLPNKLDLPDSCDDYYVNSPVKKPRTDSVSNLKDQKKVLLYLRERHETAYTALMLEVPTLHGLLRSIELKYSIAPSKVKNFYKRSRKGILVKLDDNIVRHYSHEATFIIETNIINESGDYEIVLIEIDPVTS